VDCSSDVGHTPDGVGPVVSVVIAAYNSAGTIGRALDSVYAQTYPSIEEVIVVDDGSTDDTALIVTTRFPRVRCVRQENAGCGAARNRGLEMARGEYVAFIDADDEWLSEKLEVQLGVFRGRPDASVVTADVSTVMAETPSGWRRRFPAWRPLRPQVRAGASGDRRCPISQYGFAQAFAQRRYIGYPSTWVVRREVFDEVGLFKPWCSPGDDAEFALRVLSYGLVVLNIAQPLVTRFESRWGMMCHPGNLRAHLEVNIGFLRSFDPKKNPISAQRLSRQDFTVFFQKHLVDYGLWALWRGHEDLGLAYLAEAASLRGALTRTALSRVLSSAIRLLRTCRRSRTATGGPSS